MTVDPDSTNRHDHRFRLSVPAELHLGTESIPCEAQNLSRSGALLVGSFDPPASETLDFSLKSPIGQLSVRLRGKVIRTEREGQGSRIAVEFLEMDPARRDDLEILLSRLLASPPPAAGALDGLKPGASPLEIKKALESIPIAQRIALASRAGNKERDYLRLDVNPAVLEALAHNPSLTVVEARAIAGSAYLIPGTLEALSQDPRFRNDDELRMAIAIHPKVSPATAEKVTADLKVPQIKLLLSKPGLAPALREKLGRRARRG